MMLLPVEDGGLLARGIIVVGTVGLCAAAFCIMPIKL